MFGKKDFHRCTRVQNPCGRAINVLPIILGRGVHGVSKNVNTLFVFYINKYFDIPINIDVSKIIVKT